jgi:hypothetical protein
MGILLVFLLILALVFVLIVVHESGHYLAGLMGGIPARDMLLILWAFPQHVAVLDGQEGWSCDSGITAPWDTAPGPC